VPGQSKIAATGAVGTGCPSRGMAPTGCRSPFLALHSAETDSPPSAAASTGRRHGRLASLRIEIFPADVEVTTSFYERLGFQVAGRNDGPPRYASLRMGAVQIGVCEADPVDPARRAYPAMTEIVIDVDDVHATRDRIVEQGIEPTEDLQTRDWGLDRVRPRSPRADRRAPTRGSGGREQRIITGCRSSCGHFDGGAALLSS
jgi:lactoylglutathione lyase